MQIRLYIDEDAMSRALINRLHKEFMAEGKNHSGIIIVPQQRFSVGEQIRRILKLICIKSAEEMKNQVEFLSSW